jgi:hypothetical protein
MCSFYHRCSSKTYTNDVSFFKIRQVSHLLILSLGLSLSKITNALQSVNKEKNIQCCQLKFFQYSQHKLLLLGLLVFPLVCPSAVHWDCNIQIQMYQMHVNQSKIKGITERVLKLESLKFYFRMLVY